MQWMICTMPNFGRSVSLDIWRIEQYVCFWPLRFSKPTISSAVITADFINVQRYICEKTQNSFIWLRALLRSSLIGRYTNWHIHSFIHSLIHSFTFSSVRVCFSLVVSRLWSVLHVSQMSFNNIPTFSPIAVYLQRFCQYSPKTVFLNWYKFLSELFSTAKWHITSPIYCKCTKNYYLRQYPVLLSIQTSEMPVIPNII